MTDTDMGGLAPNAGASADQIQAVARALAIDLPAFYVVFLQQSNGVESGGNLLLYSTDDIVERNETFQVREYAPGYIAIGDDSGGRSILIGLDGSAAVYLVDQGSMDPDDFIEVSPDFTEWMNQGYELQ